ncbi:MAG TPA: alpha/beta fold hydrolase [Geminicoccus sp.]|jgi:pimeloyl-ACP methyl ester carboxylesterase|uniref:alpha/beta fold hydrolase n=1 Tax=Geminicoccus sp. TaxID=2024832 RepID=UPI002E318568|nr:alpha/beta fold hydrolase [Geminicoccus sp.]HEX2526364.1 alpha/beta fold hydrolase [Geminicoccus sp.]
MKTNGDEPSQHQVTIEGSSLSIIEQGQGPAVLLGHGFLWDWRMWRPQAPVLSARCRVIMPELWGYGRSGTLPAGTHTPADLARPMLELLDQLGIDRCVVIGSSVGGMWGAHLAAHAPGRIAGLVLMNSYLGEEPTPKRLTYAAMLDQVETAGRIEDEIADAITPLFFSTDVSARKPMLPHGLRLQLDGFSAEKLRRSIVPLGRLIFDRPHALDVLAQVRAPTLVITGSEDRARPPEESRVMAELLQAELVEVPGCGHTATLERPEAVNAAILRFLDKLSWGASRPLANESAGVDANLQM